jgi:hypothetical protein
MKQRRRARLHKGSPIPGDLAASFEMLIADRIVESVYSENIAAPVSA